MSENIERFAVSVDCVVFGFTPGDPKGLRVLLMRRAKEPFADMWALPGGLVLPEETFAEAAERNLGGKTGLKDIFLEQLYTFDDPARDPRGRTISCAYYALVPPHKPITDLDLASQGAAWFPLDDVPALPFDHGDIFTMAVERLRAKLTYSPVGFNLLPEVFTIPQLQGLYEAILRRTLDRRNFARKILDTGILSEARVPKGYAFKGRPPAFYSFNRKRYQQRERSGFVLSLT